LNATAPALVLVVGRAFGL
jgi:hypothetical protein